MGIYGVGGLQARLPEGRARLDPRASQHLIGRIPAVIEVLKWPEMHDQVVATDDAFNAVAGAYIDQRQQSEFQSQL